MREYILRIPPILQPHQARQLRRPKSVDWILVAVGVTNIGLQMTVARALDEFVPQSQRQRIGVGTRCAGRSAGERHFEHDVGADVSPWVSGSSVGDRDDGLIGEELDLKSAGSSLWVPFVHLRIPVEGIYEGRRPEILHAGGKETVRVPFDARSCRQTEASLFY